MPRTDSTIPGILIESNDSAGRVTVGTSSGSPASLATLASKFAVGCVLEDTTTGHTWQNVGTVAVPSWNDIGAIAASEITLAEGSILVGNSSGVATALNAKTTTQILVGNGTTITSVAMSADATMSNAGAVTIAALAVGTTKLAANAVTSAKVDRTLLQNVTVSLSSAQLLALRATPVEVIPAVAGLIPVIDSVYAIYDAGATPYTIINVGDDLVLRQNNGTGSIISSVLASTAFIDQATDQVQTAGLATGVITAGTNANGASIVAHNEGAAEWTLGNGVVRLSVNFRYITSSL